MSTSESTRARSAALASVIKDKQELEDSCCKAAELELLADKLILDYEQAIKALNEAHKKALDDLKDQHAGIVNQIAAFSRRNREEFFGDKKTIYVCGHELKFHIAPGKVETIKGRTQEDVKIDLLTSPDTDWADKFLTHKTTLNKEAILAEWDTDSAKLSTFGITIAKPELFSFKADRVAKKAIATKTTAAA